MKKILFFSLMMFFMSCGPAPTKIKASPAIRKQEAKAAKNSSQQPAQLNATIQNSSQQSEPPKATVKKYLSLDGGAMMGIIPLILLSDIETKLGKPIYQLVDGVIGTSTGAIIGALLCIPGKDGQPFSAREILQFYRDAKNGVFSDKNLKSTFIPPKSTKQVKKMTEELKDALLDVLRSEKLSSALIPLKVASYDVNESKIYIFDSLKAKANPSHDLYARDAVLASTAISEFFTKALITVDNSPHTFVDLADIKVPGAKRAIDPTHLLYQHLEATFQPNEISTIYSLGTGISANGAGWRTRALMAQKGKIKIVRFDPNLEEYLKECKKKVTYVPSLNDKKLRNLLGGGPMNLSLPFGKPITNSLKAFEDAAEKLKSSAQYQQMLQDLKK